MAAAAGLAQRSDGVITLYLSPNYPIPPLPFELQGHIAPDDWAIRVPTLTHMSSRYYKPVFERVYLAVALMVTLVVPIATFNPIFSAIFGSQSTESSDYFFARLIGVALFLGSFLVFYLPIAFWKFIGKRRVAALLASYAEADRARPTGDFVPTWSLKIPGVFSTKAVLTVTTPPNAPITLFHPDAYLPAFIGQAPDQGGAYYYPYPADAKVRDPELPRMSVIGNFGVTNPEKKV